MMDSIFAGMQPKIGDRNALQKWLDGLPYERRRQAAAVIAARAVLRTLPAHNGSLSYFRASALAWVAARYPARASELPAYTGAFPALSEAASVADGDAYAADIAVTASLAFRDGDFWHWVSADVIALEEGGSPSALAGEPLVSKGVPSWTQMRWGIAAENIMPKHWKPWKDWYQRRLDGKELSEEIELLFATLPMDPNTTDPAEPNALLAQEIERLMAPKQQNKANCDFFISYSDTDESFAREAASVLEEAGYSIFVQYEDMAVGSNFVREMQWGLGGSQRLIAMLSPAYEASDHCQAEWAAFYNRDPSGRERRIIAFLVRETQINSLAKQVVYKSLIGLTRDQRKAAILAAVALRKPPPAPIENITAPFDFGWTAAAKLTIVAGPQNTPVFPFAVSEVDHISRLEACRKQAKRLSTTLRSGEFNARPGYLRIVNEYLEELPAAPGEGNLLEADCAARTLRGLLVEDAEILSAELKERVKRVLELHGSLRAFYSGVEHFYADVRSGQLTQPLPLDAVESFVQTIEEHTPDVFEEKVARELHKVEREPETSAPPPAAASTEAALNLPPDPFADIDPKKSHDFGVASSINALYKGFLNGKDISQSVKGWDEIAHKLGESAGPVIDWLKSFLP